MSEYEFVKRFSTEEECFDYFKKEIDQKRPKCHHCKSEKITWKDKHKYWRCLDCRSKTTVKMLTFMKNSKATYKEWLYAIYFILDAKKPMSNKELQRKLGCKHYKKVYYMSMKIRYEISKINDRLVFSLCKKLPAMDELKIKDGKLHALPKNSRLYFSSQNKVKLLRFKLSLMKCIEIKNKLLDKPFNNSFPKLYKATEICPIACENNISNTTCVLNERMDKILQHNVNRIIEGIHHGVSLLHLQVYLDEFTFKYNHRKYQIPKYELFFKKCELGNYRPT